MAQYATTTELSDYLGVGEADLPDDADRLLERASEFVDHICLKPEGIDTTETELETAARKATCAQVGWWINNEDELGIKSNIGSLSIGDYSVSFITASGETKSLPVISPRTRRTLDLEGLTYTGVSLK